MSTGDGQFIKRLLDAGRNDAAAGEVERQARIYDAVVTGGANSREEASGSFTARHSWGGIATVGLAVLSLVGLATLTTPRSASKPSDTPPVGDTPPSPTATAEPMTATAMSLGTSVWELPSVTESKRTPSAVSDPFALELGALEHARRKLRGRDPVGALALLDDFDRRFPQPRVGEEASVLRVEVLFALGRSDDARRLGKSFGARYPDSIYRARIAQLLGDTSL